LIFECSAFESRTATPAQGETSVKQRYLKFIQYDERVASDRLKRICFIDYDREIALIVQNLKNNEILGITRLTKIPGTSDARFAVIVRDDYQKKGIGKLLVSSLISIAKQEKIQHLVAYMFKENIAMQKICKQHGFEINKIDDPNYLFAKLVF